MKQEKRMRQYQEELKIKQMKNADTPSLSVERMREAQAKMKAPYLVLSGNVKHGYGASPLSFFVRLCLAKYFCLSYIDENCILSMNVLPSFWCAKVELSILDYCLYFCRQSSESSSGFATVERDFAGGLTPMLGDKKVRRISSFPFL